ncbi:MAG: deoxynucleoside kinase [Bacteroidetes bacterium]|nr:deoxynucleoside kinase [Rhodothermia bacterium]MCS7154337.1 deoxynucleoside kinase [Bacteroidota bacterium]MCX7906626.1 deoxynucleoside kinase [Bacteroidota bacterium]MDW8137093.1 deoxynucleoside kinase [Bacteroidota bacterium]MDW8285036.1 deoxynucleoside kinase [Bacteroidota bacterium]
MQRPPATVPRYLVVEGVIGVGKTSLARLLAHRLGARLVLEAFEDNPFLPRFYEDPGRYAFHTQLAFLASRYRQQRELLTPDLFAQHLVSDYLFEKDRIFAHLNLSGDELKLYESIFQLMATQVPPPDLVVYLRASVERLLENIRQRGRPYERHITREYLQALSQAYDFHFLRYRRSPLLIVDATELDFVHDPEDRELLLEQILHRPCTGTVYFHPPRKGPR